MLTFIVPEDGALELQQERQYIQVKKGSNVQVSLKFYKDIYQLYPWNLASPVALNACAKKLKELTTFVFNKSKTSADWDVAQAAQGILKLVLNSTDVGASIVGDQASFAGTTGDVLKVTIDDIEYDNIDVSLCSTIAAVAAAINTAVGTLVASVDGSGYLVITSPSIGDPANVAIDNGTDAARDTVALLFATALRTDTGYYGDLSIAQSLYFEVDFQPNASVRSYKTSDCILDVQENVSGTGVVVGPVVNSFIPRPFNFVASAGQTILPLPTVPVSIIWLAINGTMQSQLAGDFTVSGNLITMADPLDLNDTVFGIYRSAT